MRRDERGSYQLVRSQTRERHYREKGAMIAKARALPPETCPLEDVRVIPRVRGAQQIEGDVRDSVRR